MSSGPSRIHQAKVLMGLFGLLVLLTAIPFMLDLFSRGPQFWDVWQERLTFAAMKGITFGYFFFIGSSIGSFVNVVAYRMPLGKSVVFNASSCPRCRQKISGRDNLPILGWLLLGGQCRTCSLPISSRYPLVETWFGILAAALFLFEAVVGASNIPGKESDAIDGLREYVWGRNREILTLYLYHFSVVASLATLALFKLDRNRIPVLSGIFVVLACGLPAFFDSALHPVLGHSVEMSPPLSIALSIGMGTLSGILMGWIVEWLTRQAGFNPFPYKGFWFAVGITGMALGWQAMLSSLMIFSVIFFFSRFISGSIFLATGPLLGMYNLAVLLQICLWKPLSELPYWPGDTPEPARAVAGVLFTVVMLLASQHLIPIADEPEEYHPQGYGEEDSEVIAQLEAVKRTEEEDEPDESKGPTISDVATEDESDSTSEDDVNEPPENQN